MPTATLKYIRLVNSTGSLDKRFRVLAADYRPTLVRNDSRQRTVTGKADTQTGPQYRVWSLVLKVYETESDVNYGTRANLETFFGYNNPAGSPSSRLSFYDALDSDGNGVGDLYTVEIVGNLEPQLLTPMLTGAGGIFTVPLTLEQVA